MRFKNIKNCIIVTLNDMNFIIDTGSPISFSFKDFDFTINGKTYNIYNKELLPLKEGLEKVVKIDIDGLIGNDILKETGIIIDYKLNRLEFKVTNGHVCYFLKSDVIPGHYTTKDCVINSKILDKTIIDTGAGISYVSKKYLKSNQILDEKYEDYSPEIGEIKGNFYCVDIDKVTLGSGSYHHKIKVGVLPEPYEILGIDAVINLKDIVKNERTLAPRMTVSIDFKRRTLYIL